MWKPSCASSWNDCVRFERAQQPPSKSSSGDVLSGDSATSKVEQELRLDQPLITLEQLRGCPEGLQVLSVTPRAVVTPAVVDGIA